MGGTKNGLDQLLNTLLLIYANDNILEICIDKKENENHFGFQHFEIKV
jgi:hypothetical protein